MQNRITPEKVEKLEKNQIVIVGTNKDGAHLGGFAAYCKEHFGLVDGVARGRSGDCYAIDTMSGLDAIKEQIPAFIEAAKVLPLCTFLVTQIGTGIAGFTVEQIAPLFAAAKDVENIYLPKEFWDILNVEKVIHGYKGFDENWKCKDFQFEVGKEFTIPAETPIKICSTGFHFCKNPLDIFRYYKPGKTKFAEVEGTGEEQTHNEDSKVAVRKIKIKAEIKLPGIIEAGIEVIWKKIKDAKPQTEWASGNYSTGAASGYYSTGAASGNSSTGAASGNYSTGAASGDYSTGAASGYYSTGAASGNYCKAIVSGKDSIAVANGVESKAKGAIGCYLVLSEYKDGKLIDVKCAKVDGATIKVDTFYQLVNGTFKEVK